MSGPPVSQCLGLPAHVGGDPGTARLPRAPLLSTLLRLGRPWGVIPPGPCGASDGAGRVCWGFGDANTLSLPPNLAGSAREVGAVVTSWPRGIGHKGGQGHPGGEKARRVSGGNL